MAATVYKPGQRYFSTAEPELGLGTVLRVEGRAVQVVYTRSGVVRQYASHGAPLTRIEIKPGDLISVQGQSHRVDQVLERDGVQVYRCGTIEVPESALDDEQVASQADARLISGRVDRNARFQLRVEALERRARARRSPGFGIHSARVALLEHQLRVVDCALRQAEPRVLLADEVGLGKTIEAGLILSQLLAGGRATRALILVPEPLVYQWFIELRRRFNLRPAIYDEERVASIEAGGQGGNPFLDDQLVLTDTAFLTRAPHRGRQAIDAGWDVLVVDEAHHLAWSPEEASPEYQLVEALALSAPSVILLTATPEQLGRSGHFARLRLLDPARYSDLAHYQADVERYGQISRLARILDGGGALNAGERAELAALFAAEPEILARLDGTLDELDRRHILDALIDRHGTGRVMFRNRREWVGGFPRRILERVELPAVREPEAAARLLAEFKADVGLAVGPAETAASELPDEKRPEIIALTHDPRFAELLRLLAAEPGAKFVLICRHAYKVLALEAALRLRSGVKVARFHEGLSLAQRDRNAAYFADPEGARLLLCSEIGSEGRNFQFAQHLILWDLPPDPDLLEQRIGRLDRIGQKGDVRIHVAAPLDSAQHALLRWYHEALDAFASSPADGRELYRAFGARVLAAAIAVAEGTAGAHAALDALIEASRELHRELSARIREGRDHLLDLAARRGAEGQALKRALADDDADTSADEFILRLHEHFGVDADELAPRTYRFDTEMVSTDAFAGLREGAQTITFERDFALVREDVELLRIDHPLVQSSIDLLLGSEDGNCACLVDPELPSKDVILEAVYVLECIADRSLDAERYLPPQPLHVAVDSKLTPRTYLPSSRVLARADDLALNLQPLREVLRALIPPLCAEAERLAAADAARVCERALEQAEIELGGELARLRALRTVNAGIRASELKALEQRLAGLRAALPTARVRLDALRLVVHPSFFQLRPR